MKFKDYFNALTERQQEAFAKRAETSVDYIRTHLIPARKVPRRQLLKSLIVATQGSVSYMEMLDHFYKEADVA